MTLEIDPENQMNWGIQEVAAYFGVTRHTVYRWMNREENPLPFYRPGGGTPRFVPQEVEGWGKRSQ